MKIKDLSDKEIWSTMKKHHRGYWYISVGTYTRRSGELKISNQKVFKLIKLFGSK